jgi:hypothetical protein
VARHRLRRSQRLRSAETFQAEDSASVRLLRPPQQIHRFRDAASAVTETVSQSAETAAAVRTPGHYRHHRRLRLRLPRATGSTTPLSHRPPQRAQQQRPQRRRRRWAVPQRSAPALSTAGTAAAIAHNTHCTQHSTINAAGSGRGERLQTAVAMERVTE